MKILWIALTVAILHDGQAEHSEQKEYGRQECTFETCGSDMRPIPLIQRELLREESRSRKEGFFDDIIPQFKEVNKTNFQCEGKPYIPGFYADMETNCKVFHICLEKDVEHYVCPGNTTFDQKALICKPKEKVHCHLTPTYYIMNANMHTGRPTIPGTQQFAFSKDGDKWLYDLIKGDKEQFNATDADALERNLMRVLILMQFVDVSDVIAGILEEEETHEDFKEERSLNSSQLTGQVLSRILGKIFPLLPVKFSSEPRPKREESTSVPEQRSGRDFDDSWGDLQENNPDESEQGTLNVSSLGTFHNQSASSESLGTSHNQSTSSESLGSTREGRSFRKLRYYERPGHKALELVDLILQSVGKNYGKLPVISRNALIYNYVRYLNMLTKADL